MIKGQSIALSPVEARDANLLFEWINDPSIVHLHGPFRPIDSESHRIWMERLPKDASTVVFAIRETPTDRLIGIVQLVGIHAVHRSAELRIRIGAAGDRGNGFGSEAVDLCCQFAFSDLGLTRVFLNVFADNGRAISAYERAGFGVEGVFRKAAFIGGEWKDVVAMARLATSTKVGFTEAEFGKLISALKSGSYRFASFGDEASDRHVLWRHDVDASVHRAARLARIEAEAGVSATYFLNPRSSFYNLAEPAVLDKIRLIVEAGHDIGLHFDAAVSKISTWDLATLQTSVDAERRLLETLVRKPIAAVSWHNPDQTNLLEFGAERIAGLVNAYSERLRQSHVYASDSNGYWRFKPMPEVIAEGHERLHLLTHPEWWTPSPMPAPQRLDRARMGRLLANLRSHEAFLAKAGRKETPD